MSKQLAASVPTGAHRSGRCGRQDRGTGGAVTVEFAIALVGLVVVLAMLTWSLLVLGMFLRAGDAARAGARLAARGEPYATIRDEVGRTIPGAEVNLEHEATPAGNRETVTVRTRLTPPLGPLSGIGSVEVVGRASALQEAL